MREKSHKLERIRHANSDARTGVWQRQTNGLQWKLVDEPIWSVNSHYIVDDVHSTIRKICIDRPGTRLKYHYAGETVWRKATTPTWDVNNLYEIDTSIVYPIIKRERSTGIIVRFTDLTKGVVVRGNGGLQSSVGFSWECFNPCDRDDLWEDVDGSATYGVPEWYKHTSPKHPILCWVWDEKYEDSVPRQVWIGNGYIARDTESRRWRFALPIDPSSCYQSGGCANE